MPHPPPPPQAQLSPNTSTIVSATHLTLYSVAVLPCHYAYQSCLLGSQRRGEEVAWLIIVDQPDEKLSNLSAEYIHVEPLAVVLL